jgi:1,4-dihydroxy-2-naphthoate octaprenyltransferase
MSTVVAEGMNGSTLPRKGSVGAWLLAARPRTLPVAVAPVLVGAAVSHATGHVRVAPLVAAMSGALFIQIGTNFANDVFDFEKGADDERRVGPVRAVQAGLLSARAMRAGMVFAFAIAALFGVYLVAVGGWPIVAIGVASIASGIAYTGGPYPLGYNGLGDAFVFAFFGVAAVTGTTLVAGRAVPPLAWAASLPVGALATAVLVVNNVRDRETDVLAGKRTLVVRFGRRFGLAEYATLLAVAWLAPVVMAGLGLASPWALASLVTIPRGLRLFSELRRRTDGPSLNECLAGTAKLMLMHSALLALGIALTRAP